MFAKYYNLEDTIAAIATPSGKGAVGIIRISGKKAFEIAEKLSKKSILKWKSHTIHLVEIYEKDQILDQGLFLKFDGPNSYTGEHTIEINCHGSGFILNQILNACIGYGARLASAGEFTFRAFSNGKIDLSQAEAVSDVINSENEISLKNALKHLKGGFTKSILSLKNDLIHLTSLIELELDFGEEDVEFADRNVLESKIKHLKQEIEYLIQSFIEGNAITKGIPVAIVGKPNSGKSSLLNSLLNDERAIVSNIEGTTRDTIEEVFNINGVPFRLIDTAGIRETSDLIEQIGVKKAYEKIKEAQIIIYLISSENYSNQEIEEFYQFKNSNIQLIVGINKIDLINDDDILKIKKQFQEHFEEYQNIDLCLLSTFDKKHIEILKLVLSKNITQKLENKEYVLSNVRHYQALKNTLEHLNNCAQSLNNNVSQDLLAEDLRMALYHLSEITGEICNDDILENIFRNFCIGK